MDAPFVGGGHLLRSQTIHLGQLLRVLNRRLREVDPDWRSRNVETLAVAFQTVNARHANMKFL
jgi:hypothetical protein